MVSLTVRNVDDEVVRHLRIRTAEHGWSTEAKRRALLRTASIDTREPPAQRHAIERLVEFRRRATGRGSLSTGERLNEPRTASSPALTGSTAASGKAA